MSSHKIHIKLIITLIITTLPFFGFSPYVRAEELKITGNGSDSGNTISVTQETTTHVEQSNNADINNNIQQTADTGNNTASENSGEASIETGNINTTTEVSNQANISAVNTSNCCNNNSTEATISDNGSGSDNNIEINKSNETSVGIKQDAQINNDADVNANTGNNEANDNNGNVAIDTGNIEGRVEIVSENINIDAVDIEECCQDLSVRVIGNGTDSDNSIIVKEENEITVRLDNNAEVNNEVDIDANTGNNEANDNNGDVSIETGDIDFEAIIKNGPINVKLVSIGGENVIKPPEEEEENGDNGDNGDNDDENNGEEEENEGAAAQPSAQPPQGGFSAVGQPTGEVLAAAIGEVLPISGNNVLFYLTLMSFLMFLLGLYLRLHPGRDPSSRIIKL